MPLTPAPIATPNIDINLVTATAIVNTIPPALSFVYNLLYPQGQALATEDIEIAVRTAGKNMAPFIKPGTRPPNIKGLDVALGTYRAPMIATARGVAAYETLLKSYPQFGSYRYNNGAQAAAIYDTLRADFEQLAITIDNRKEWMACELLKRAVSYSSETEAFTLTYPKDASTEFSLGAGVAWNDLDYTTSVTLEQSADATNPMLTFMQASRAMHQLERLAPNLVLLGSSAADAFVTHPRVMKQLDNLNFNAGALTIMEQFTSAGARYLGRYAGGMQVWAYEGQLKLDSGSTGSLIASGDAFFIHSGPMAEFDQKYGLIPNWKLSLGRQPTSIQQLLALRPVPARVWADVIPDQGGHSIEGVIYTRPLPILRRPNCIIRATVI